MKRALQAKRGAVNGNANSYLTSRQT